MDRERPMSFNPDIRIMVSITVRICPEHPVNDI